MGATRVEEKLYRFAFYAALREVLGVDISTMTQENFVVFRNMVAQDPIWPTVREAITRHIRRGVSND